MMGSELADERRRLCQPSGKGLLLAFAKGAGFIAYLPGHDGRIVLVE